MGTVPVSWLVRRVAEILGRAGLWNAEGGPGVEQGWMMRRSAWGCKYATEAARSALDWAWRHTNIDHIISVIRAENAPSIRIAEKLGERLEAIETRDRTTVYTFGIRRSSASASGGSPAEVNAPEPRTG
jgi:RimJ/RimL family protein N-acetyltransferase